MKNLIRTEWRLLLFGVLMTFWSSPGQTFFISLFSGAIREDLGLSHGEFGAIYSLATLTSAAVVVWSGSLIDRVDLRLFTYVVIIGLAISCLSLSLSNTITALVIAIFLLRQFGQSLMMLTASTTMVRYLDQHKGKATALGGMGYAFSEAIMPSIIIALLVALGWRTSLQTTSLTLIVIVLPFAWLLLRGHGRRHRQYLDDIRPAPVASDSATRDKPAIQQPQTPPQRQWTRGEVIRDGRFYLFMPAFLAHTMIFTGFIFHQVHLTDAKGWSLAVWGSLFFMYAIVSIVTRLATGIVIDRIGAIRLLPYVALPMGLGLVALSLSSHIAVAIIFLGLLGITTGIQTTISAPFWAEMYGSRNLGAIKSLSSAIIAFGSALSPIGLGWFIDGGVSIEVLALWSVGYVLVAVGLAGYGYWLTVKK